MKLALQTTAVLAVVVFLTQSVAAAPFDPTSNEPKEIRDELIEISVAPDGAEYSYVTSIVLGYHSDIVGYKEGTDIFVRVQSRIEGYEATVIRAECFKDCKNVESFVIPNGIQSVGASAFSGCTALNEIIFLGDKPALETGWDAGLEGVAIRCLDTHHDSWMNIGRSVEQIKVETYSSNGTSFRYIELNGTLTVLEHVSGTEIEIPSKIRNIDVTHINDSAFLYDENSGADKITKVVIGEGVVHIGVAAFKYCEFMREVTFPSTLMVIMDEAFRMPIDNVNWSRSQLERIELNNGLEYIGFEAFRMCYKVDEVNIPDSVTHYGDGAFRVCTSMKKVAIGNGVKVLGEFSFDNCFALSEVNLPAYLEKIGDNCFYLDRSLRSIALPESVTDIGSNAFYGCESLTDVSMPGTAGMKPGCFTLCPVQNLTVTGTEIGTDLRSFIDNDWKLPGASAEISMIVIDSSSSRMDVGFNGKDGKFIRFTDISVNTSGGQFLDGTAILTGSARAGKTFAFSDVWKKCDASTIRVYSTSTALGKVIGGGTYPNGSVTTVKAVPNAYCEFVGWSDGVREPERDIIVGSDICLVAEFRGSVTYTLSFVSVPGGTGGCPVVGKYVAGTEVNVTATPIDGYHFIGWSDGVTTPERKVLMDSDKELTAYFGNLAITFDLNGAQGAVDTIYTNSGWEVTLPSPDVELHGKKLVGWTIDGVRYEPGTKYIASSPVKATAVWDDSGDLSSIIFPIISAAIVSIVVATIGYRTLHKKKSEEDE